MFRPTHAAGDAASRPLYRGSTWLCAGILKRKAQCKSRGAPELIRWAGQKKHIELENPIVLHRGAEK
jgi:hypothetical protein